MTIYTDASIKNGEAAWAAYWVERNVLVGDTFNLDGHSNNYAELFAIHKGLKFIRNRHDKDTIRIVTDSMCAIRWLTGNRPRLNSKNYVLFINTDDLLQEYNSYEVIHTKAHGTDKHNNLCDKLARSLIGLQPKP